MDAHLHFHPIDTNSLNQAVRDNVAQALREDIGDGDISASLIGPTTQAKARVITRQPGIFCGTLWVDEILEQIDTSVKINWQVEDGDSLVAEQVLFELQGNARSLLSAERNMLNFVQFLSGTATRTAAYAALLAGTNTQLLDTRKTVPGLRLAQKYAVKCGGGRNHRIGLFDAFLLKENHILSAGGIRQAVLDAQKNHPGKPTTIKSKITLPNEKNEFLLASPCFSASTGRGFLPRNKDALKAITRVTARGSNTTTSKRMNHFTTRFTARAIVS